jgi:oxygen-independent coproporphyrinogen-3 oxidase
MVCVHSSARQISVIRVPRYTSYPTAVHFHEGIGANQYLEWLDALGRNQTLSLYFHIPFCRQLCWFCGCHTKIVNHYQPIKNYLEILEKEVALVAGHVASSTVKHIHFGGGSPSAINAGDFSRFVESLNRAFVISDEAEFAIEVDPRTADEAKVISYAKSGITRASLGVQDFDHDVQQAINRIQSYSLVSKVVESLRRHGINSINLDLIYGLPKQTVNTIEETIDKTLALEPDRISLFGYAHVPWLKKHQNLIPQASLPGSEERMDMYGHAANILLANGYIAVGLDHFVRSEDPMAQALHGNNLHRNFQGYTTDSTTALVGLGVSAISTLPQGYAQNTSRYGEYTNQVKAGSLPISRGVAFTEKDRIRSEIIMSLMCNLRAEVAQGEYSPELKRLAPYFKSNEVSYENEVLTVSEKARDQLRIIASVFDEYLDNSQHQYSVAV